MGYSKLMKVFGVFLETLQCRQMKKLCEGLVKIAPSVNLPLNEGHLPRGRVKGGCQGVLGNLDSIGRIHSLGTK